MPERSSPARASRRYTVRFAIAMAAYLITLPVALVVLPRLAGSPARFVVVLIPMIPFAVLGWAVWRHLVESDEMQRQLQFQALALAFAVGSVLTFSYGMLQLVGAPSVRWLFVWPVYAVCWLLASLWARWRYR